MKKEKKGRRNQKGEGKWTDLVSTFTLYRLFGSNTTPLVDAKPAYHVGDHHQKVH